MSTRGYAARLAAVAGLGSVVALAGCGGRETGGAAGSPSTTTVTTSATTPATTTSTTPPPSELRVGGTMIGVSLTVGFRFEKVRRSDSRGALGSIAAVEAR